MVVVADAPRWPGAGYAGAEMVARLRRLEMAVLVALAALAMGADECGGDDPDSAGAGGGAGAADGAGGSGGAGGAGGAAEACEPWTKKPCYTGPSGTEGVGACVAGFAICNAAGLGHGPCEADVVPEPERCETPADEDCDGVANEGCAAP